MIQNIFNIKKDLLIFLISLFLLSSCKHSNLTGLPGEQVLNSLFTDTLSFKSITIREDSVSANAGSPNHGTLAYFADPVFGKSISSIAFEVIPAKTVQNFGTNTVLDSIVLVLNYSGFYGDSNSIFKAKVHRLKEKLLDSGFQSNRNYKYDASTLAEKSFVAKIKDSLIIQSILKGKKDSTKKVGPQLRIKLDNAFGEEILKMENITKESFLNLLNGFYLELEKSTQNGNGGIIQLNLSTIRSGLSLYYKLNDSNSTDTLQFDFPTSSTTLKFNKYEKDYTGTAVQQQLQDSTKGDQFIYLQPLAGVNGKFEIPHLNNLLKSGLISVNKARFKIFIDPNSITSYGYPSSLILRNLDTLGRYTDIAVAGVKSKEYYEFDLSIFIQDLITKRTSSKGLIVLPNGRLASKERLVLGGYNNQNLKPKLILTYTEIN